MEIPQAICFENSFLNINNWFLIEGRNLAVSTNSDMAEVKSMFREVLPKQGISITNTYVTEYYRDQNKK